MDVSPSDAVAEDDFAAGGSDAGEQSRSLLDGFVRAMSSPPSEPFTDATTSREELWNPADGGIDRLAWVAEQTATAGGVPLALYLVIALAEIYANHAGTSEPDDTDDDRGGYRVEEWGGE